MRLQCNLCETAEAKVFCCADEAALCLACDEKVHAANKLAGEHQRVRLSSSSSSSSSQMPKCDICQGKQRASSKSNNTRVRNPLAHKSCCTWLKCEEASGFFFCLQDRALLCRKCDVAIHTANPYVSGHQRFLLTGVTVDFETTDPGVSSSNGKSPSSEKASETKSNSTSRTGAPMSFSGGYNEVLPETAGGGSSMPTRVSDPGGSTLGSIQSWQMDDLFGLADFNQSYGYMDNGSSEADSGKCGDSDSSPILRSAEEEVDDDECLGVVPDSSWVALQIPSPPTSSGLYWPKNSHYQSDGAAYVPDICHSVVKNPFHSWYPKSQR